MKEKEYLHRIKGSRIFCKRKSIAFVVDLLQCFFCGAMKLELPLHKCSSVFATQGRYGHCWCGIPLECKASIKE